MTIASRPVQEVGGQADNERVKPIVVCVVAAAALSACGGHGSSPAAVPKPDPATTRASTTSTGPSADPDRTVQGHLRDALTAALVIYTDDSDFDRADVDGLRAIEPTLTFQTGTSQAPNQISVIASPHGQSWWAVARSASGHCFGAEDDAQIGPPGLVVADLSAPGCRAPAIDPHWTAAQT